MGESELCSLGEAASRDLWERERVAFCGGDSEV